MTREDKSAAARTPAGAAISLHSAVPSVLSLSQAYPILRLRVDVFVVEQECPYPELDGRDLEPSARWVWATDEAGEVTATLRVLTDSDGRARIGRVATAKSARSNGTASAMMEYALQLLAADLGAADPAGTAVMAGTADAAGATGMAGTERLVVLEAQSRLERWYERFGFSRSGEEYVEDGIPHVPMTRTLTA